ncbi:hypothetical protein [Arthrobacter crystallopoietes]|uniref:hypothetical protein n=1 Tax=Crystallibacter crystallopoietes TaxID=37928 RepID=UPI00111131DF|nr:hypothetical protein [Arthrobacter crystallopoietes]
MEAALKRVWAAAAALEMRRGDMDRAQTALDDNIGEALHTGTNPDAIAGAVNLAPARRSRPARQLARQTP